MLSISLHLLKCFSPAAPPQTHWLFLHVVHYFEFCVCHSPAFKNYNIHMHVRTYVIHSYIHNIYLVLFISQFYKNIMLEILCLRFIRAIACDYSYSTLLPNTRSYISILLLLDIQLFLFFFSMINTTTMYNLCVEILSMKYIQEWDCWAIIYSSTLLFLTKDANELLIIIYNEHFFLYLILLILLTLSLLLDILSFLDSDVIYS